MGLNNFILNCEKDNEALRQDIKYYKNYNQRLLKENQKYKEVIDKTIMELDDPFKDEDGDASWYEIADTYKEQINKAIDILKEVK